MGTNACKTTEKVRDISIEESYIHYKQSELHIPAYYRDFILLIQENSNKGGLSTTDYFSILRQVGAVKEKTIEEANKLSKKWYKFFCLFSNKGIKCCKYDSLNLIIGLSILCEGDLQTKLECIYDCVDNKLRGYINKDQVIHIINTLLVSITCYIPFYCSDYPYEKKKFFEMYQRWKKYSHEICSDIANLITVTSPIIKKQEFVLKISTSFSMLLDPTELRNYVDRESKKKELEQFKEASAMSFDLTKSRSNHSSLLPALQLCTTTVTKSRNYLEPNASFSQQYTPINSTPEITVFSESKDADINK
jgi:hypothetical protein